MSENNPKGVSTKDRLTYIEPNYLVNNNSGENSIKSTDLYWNQEDLAMFVDLQVIVPRREDKGQVNYLTHLKNVSVKNNNDNPVARYISYMGGKQVSPDKNSESYLTDSYTNISFQEIENGEVVDQESLGINSIDINFDAHFFPLVTMNFTDVRGSSLFMPSEYEFDKSMEGNASASSSFFKALFHFPYPRFLLSVKGFYGNKVTFQLSVSDFRSSFQPETGNYDITVQFIGYVYGLYTDLPLNLVMASPYYNSQYWDNKVKDGTFTYVGTSSITGNPINKYIEFLTKLEKKDINSQTLNKANITKEYLYNKNKVLLLNDIVKLHKSLAIAPVSNDKTSAKYIGDNVVFVWGRYKNGTNGFLLDDDLASEYYEKIKSYLNVFNDAESIDDITNYNDFLTSLNKQGISIDAIKSDKNNKYFPLFKALCTGKNIGEYFEFSRGNDGNSYWNIVKQKKGFTDVASKDDKYIQTDLFDTNHNLQEGGKISQTSNISSSLTSGVFIEYGKFCNNLTNKIETLKKSIKQEQESVAKELGVVFEEVIGFSPTVENFYRMLFAHIDCFMDYFNRKVLGDIAKDTKDKKRTSKYLKINLDETDIPKTLVSTLDSANDDLDIYPFPAYFTNKGTLNGVRMVAEYPGESMSNTFSKIREVKSVDEILSGIKQLSEDYETLINSDNNTYSDKIFSKLSVLYNGENPWNTLKLSKTNDSEDVYHILYYYLCILLADKVIGTNTNRGVSGNVNWYVNSIVNLLNQKVDKWTVTFRDTLREVSSQIKSNGVSNILDNFKDYRLLEFEKHKNKNGSEDTSTLYVKNNAIPLRITDDTLMIPINSNNASINDGRYLINIFNNTVDGYFGIKNVGILENNSLDDTWLKKYNDNLIELSEATPFLNEIKSITYGDYCVSMPRYAEETIKLARNGNDEVREYPIVTFNYLDDKPFKYSNYVINGETKKIVNNVIKIFSYKKKEDKEIVSQLKYKYENGDYDTDFHSVNFIGRKLPGIFVPSYSNSPEYAEDECCYDENPSINLFSGMKEMVKNGVMYFKNGVALTDENNNLLIGQENIDNYLPLMESSRCNYDKYAFATYFLATLSGNRGLTNICGILNTNNSIAQPVRTVDALYLGGILYFQRMYNQNEDIRLTHPWEFRELINEDGSLGRGLLYNERSDFEKVYKSQKEVILLEEVYDIVNEDLISYFINWCNNELFDNGMYDELAFIDGNYDKNNANKDYVDYVAFCGNINNGDYAFVQGYKTNSHCEKWLRDLSYGVSELVLLRENTSNIIRTSNEKITVNEITNFIDTLYDSVSDRIKENEKEEQNNSSQVEKECNETLDQKRALYYLLKNLYDKWLCSYTADEFNLQSPQDTLESRKQRFGDVNFTNSNQERMLKNNFGAQPEYNNFVYVDQYFNDISSMYMMDADTIGDIIKDVYTGNKNMDIYAFMAFMAEKNNLMLLALPVYNNMYNAKSITSVFSPNTLFNQNQYDEHNGIGTTYVVMYTSDVSHNPSIYQGYEYSRDYLDIADVANNHGAANSDLSYFGQVNRGNDNLTQLNYDVSAFAVSYSMQNQMYFKKVNVSMDNPKITDEVIRNTLMLSEGGSQGDTNQPVAIGQNIYSIYSNRSYTCTVEMMGCANIMPLMYFQLNNIPMFRGLYMIINVKHSIRAGDMTTIFTGVRVSRYSMPDVTNVMLNSNIFQKLESSDSWKDGKKVITCPKCSKVLDNIQFTKDFSLNMLINTNKEGCNSPNDIEISNLRALAVNILQPLYDAWKEHTNGGTFIVTSGYRSQCINSLVGGVETSDHRNGYAADLQAQSGGTQKQFKQFVKCWLWRNGKPRQFKQFIDETSNHKEWVHISYSETNNEQRMTLYVDGKYSESGKISDKNVGDCT